MCGKEGAAARLTGSSAARNTPIIPRVRSEEARLNRGHEERVDDGLRIFTGLDANVMNKGDSASSPRPFDPHPGAKFAALRGFVPRLCRF